MATLEKSATTTIEKTALGRLDREGRLLNAVLKSPTKNQAGLDSAATSPSSSSLSSRTKSARRSSRSSRF